MKTDGMDNSVPSLPKKLLWLWAGNLFALALVIYAFIIAILSFRELLIVVVMIGVTNVVLIMVTAKELAKKLGEPIEHSGHPIDLDTRKRLRWRIRMAKMRIGLFAIALLIAIKEISNGPVIPLLLGFIIALYITAKSVQTVIQLNRTLAAENSQDAP